MLEIEKTIEEVIYELTLLLIKQEIKDKTNGKVTYVKKTRAYKDLIKLLKELNNEKYKQINEK